MGFFYEQIPFPLRFPGALGNHGAAPLPIEERSGGALLLRHMLPLNFVGNPAAIAFLYVYMLFLSFSIYSLNL